MRSGKRQEYGELAVELVPPNGTENLARGTKKNGLKVMRTVETHVGKTRYGIPLIRVGYGVIAVRCSENILWSKA